MALMQVDVVSMQEKILTAKATFVSLTGLEGDLGIAPNHAPLLTKILPGPIAITKEDGEIEVFFVKGGFLEVMSNMVTVLANVVHRTDDLVEAEAQKAVEAAEKKVARSMEGELDYAMARKELMNAVGMLRTLKEVRSKMKSLR